MTIKELNKFLRWANIRQISDDAEFTQMYDVYKSEVKMYAEDKHFREAIDFILGASKDNDKVWRLREYKKCLISD